MSDAILENIRSFIKQKIPLIDYTDLEMIHVTEKDCLVKIPCHAKNKNHLDSMYFGALAIGADCAGGLMALYHMLKHKIEMNFVFKDFSAQFLQRPEHDVFFQCQDGDIIKAAVESAQATGERVSCQVNVEAYTLNTHIKHVVATFQLTLSMKLRSPQR